MSNSYTPKSKQEAAKLQRVRNTLAYQELIAWQVKQALMKGAKAVEGYAKLTLKIFFAPDAKGKLPEDRGDLDNLEKSIVDGLQYGGAFVPKKGCKKGNDKAVIRYGEGTGIYLGVEDRIELTLEPIEL
jgi:Holliday junction resolvase RusA-like endonuclease